MSRWWRRSVLDHPYLTVAYDDGHEEIYRASAMGGAVGELVLIPVLDAGYTGDPKTASTTPAPVPGEVKIVRYLTRYQEPALQDLSTFIRPKR